MKICAVYWLGLGNSRALQRPCRIAIHLFIQLQLQDVDLCISVQQPSLNQFLLYSKKRLHNGNTEFLIKCIISSHLRCGLKMQQGRRSTSPIYLIASTVIFLPLLKNSITQLSFVYSNVNSQVLQKLLVCAISENDIMAKEQ